MVDLHKDYPHYDWHHNVGYGTAAHIEGLYTHGLTPQCSFGPCSASYSMISGVIKYLHIRVVDDHTFISYINSLKRIDYQ